jgi:hypothetical protein
MRKYLIIFFLILLAIPTIASAYDVGFGYEGTFSFNCSAVPTCPSNMSYAFVSMAGGGGSGKSTTWGSSPNQNLFGYGGSAGEYGNYTMVPIFYTTAYSITVGGHGDTNTVYNSTTVANNGGDTTAFGYTKHGGAAGTTGFVGATPGGNGASTNFYTSITHPSAILAAAGGNSGAYNGGLAGIGKGAGGGGAASNSSLVYNVGQAIGGNGGDGIVYLWEMNSSGSNVPYYSASPTTTGVGNVITFTDESILHDAVNLTYLWDFGDGEHSHTAGSTSHVYLNYGVYTTNLTISSSLSTSSLVKPDYITITNTPITAWYTQKTVRIKTVDAYGNDLVGSDVNISYISNSLPSKDTTWLTSAFGISQAVATQMVDGSVAMQGYTGTDGSASFAMFPAIQYGITVTNTTLGMSKYVTIYPQDNDYIIYCPLGSQAAPTPKLSYLNGSAIYVTEPNSSFVSFNVSYIDTSDNTDNVLWNITYANNGTTLYSHDFGDPGTALQTDTYLVSTSVRGQEYIARYFAHRTSPTETIIVGVSVITKGVSGIMVSLGIEDWVTAAQARYCYNLISVCALFFLAAFASARKESVFCIIIPIFTGVFLWFGWIQLATASATQGFMFTTVVMGLLGVVFYMNDRNREMYGTGGAGNKLITVALFIAFFSVGLTLASGFNIFPAGDIVAPPGTCISGMACDAYNNIDFSTMSGSLSQNYGMGGNLVSALAALPGITLSALVTLINVVVGVFFFPFVLNAVLEGIWHGISSNPVYLLFLAALEIVILIIYITGFYELISGRTGGTI